MITGGRADWAEGWAKAFAATSLRKLGPKLLRRARRYLRGLGWAEGKDHRPAVLEAQELVDEAVESCLAGKRRCVPRDDATERTLFVYLSSIMRSILTNRYTSAAVACSTGDDALDLQMMDESPSPSRRFAAASLVALCEQSLQGDAEALAVFGAICDGHDDREKIGEALGGWPVERVKVVRWRMRQRLVAQGITWDHDGEAEPPSSSPRGRDDDDSRASGERRRAPREPDRGAGLVARRRR